MTVAAILSVKGREVVTVPASESVTEALSTLAKHNIGALVVVDDAERIIGIVSERDLVRALASGGADILRRSIDAVMTRSVVTCDEKDSIDELMTRMTRGRFRHVPVVANGRLAGIVSIGDVVKARIEQVERDAEAIRTYIASA
jgi:CBS domain-containing protein